MIILPRVLNWILTKVYNISIEVFAGDEAKVGIDPGNHGEA